jgi:putative phosphoserine phosphatase/1-acylglycerol-3-phosphate O-acyltransferase
MVPIVIHNAGDVAPKGDFVFRPATVEVDVLPPVDTGDWRADTIERHVAEVRQMFQATLGQADAEDTVSSMPVPETGPAPRAQAPAETERAPPAVAAGRPPLKKKLRKKKALKKATLSTTAGAAAKKTPRKKPYKKKVGVKSLAGKATAAKAMKGDAKGDAKYDAGA